MTDTNTPQTPPQTQLQPQPQSPRGLRIALAISVALNLGVAGLVAGAVLHGGPHGSRMVRDLDFGPFGEAFSPADRDALRDGFFQQAEGFRGMRDEMQRNGQELMAVLRSEPLDRARLEAVMDKQSRQMQDRLDLGRRLVIDRIAAMSPAQRLAFADRLERAFDRGPGDRGGDRRPD